MEWESGLVTQYPYEYKEHGLWYGGKECRKDPGTKTVPRDTLLTAMGHDGVAIPMYRIKDGRAPGDLPGTYLVTRSTDNEGLEAFSTHAIDVLPKKGTPLSGTIRFISDPRNSKTVEGSRVKFEPRTAGHFANDGIRVHRDGMPVFLDHVTDDGDIVPLRYTPGTPITREQVLPAIRRYYTELMDPKIGGGRVNTRFVVHKGVMFLASLGNRTTEIPGLPPPIKKGDQLLVSYTPSEWYAKTAPIEARALARSEFAACVTQEDINAIEADGIPVMIYAMKGHNGL